MFENFTDRARKVMMLANQEAQRLNHEHIGTEHLLLGLIKEGTGVGGQVLKEVGITLVSARLQVEKIVQSGTDMVTMGKLPQTPRLKRVILWATEEASSQKHQYVGTEYLLLALLRDPDGVAAQVLVAHGLKLEDVTAHTMALLGAPLAPSVTLLLDGEGKEYPRVMLYELSVRDNGNHASSLIETLVAILILPDDKKTAVLIGGSCGDSQQLVVSEGLLRMTARVCCPCRFCDDGAIQAEDKRAALLAELGEVCRDHQIRRLILRYRQAGLTFLGALVGVELIEFGDCDLRVLSPFKVVTAK